VREGIEAIVFRTVGDQASLWEAVGQMKRPWSTIASRASTDKG
jgi:hypothetical protein